MYRVAIGTCVAMAFAVSLAAQAGTQPPAAGQQPPSTTQQPPSTQPATPAPTQTPSSSAAPGEMTLTGCLQKTADGFALANVMADSKSPGGAAAPTGTAGAATPGAASSAAGATSTWNLKGGDLAAHVGHRIAVTGKAAAASSGAATTTGAAGATTTDPASRPAAGAAGASASSARTLEVASVKMIAATCP
jgi:hypothetical protein